MCKMKLFVYLSLSVLVLGGCTDKKSYKGCHDPIYISYESLRSDYPAVSAPREITEAAKIYVYGDILLVNEKNIGIHVIDNRVRTSPQAKYFIDIPGNIDMAVKEGYLYVDSFMDLVILDIRDIDNIQTVRRKNEIFPYDDTQALSEEDLAKDRCYPDSDLGVIVGYE